MAYGPQIGNGSGDSKANAINIDSASAWATLAATSADWEKYCLVTSDIDFENIEIASIGGDSSNKFGGTFDGDGHTFSNAIVNTTSVSNSVGLFRRIDDGAIIKNLTCTNFEATGESPTGGFNSYCAIIVGESTSGGLVHNCHVVNSTITHLHTIASSRGFAAPIVGSNHGDISSCTVTGGTVKGDITNGTGLHLGGIVGFQTGVSGASGLGTTEYCSSSTIISDLGGNSTVIVHLGGIAGYVGNNDTNFHVIDNCVFTGSISYSSASEINVGAITGYNQGVVTNNTSEGVAISITSTEATTLSNIAGVCGVTYTASTMTGNHIKADITAVLTGAGYVGGLTGYAHVSTSNNSYIGDIDITASGTGLRVGGLVGLLISDNNLSQSDFRGNIICDSAEEVDIGGLVGYTSEDITGCSATGTLTVIATDASTVSQIGGACGESTNTSNIIDNTIELDITLTATKSANVGGLVGHLFGNLTTSSYTGDIDITANGTGSKNGSIVGYARTGSTISQCKTEANLAFTQNGTYCGGAFGQLDIATVSNCYVRGTIYDNSASSTELTFSIWGGFVGYVNGGTIDRCYTSIGPWSVGGIANNQEGFVGLNTAGTFTDCFTDSTIAGHTTTLDGGEWKTAVELQTPSTYDNTGFNFDPFNNRVWKMEPGIYPLLAWQETEKGYGGDADTSGDLILNKPNNWFDGTKINDNTKVESVSINDELKENLTISNSTINNLPAYLLKSGGTLTIQSDHPLYNYSSISSNNFIGKLDENIYAEIRYTVNGKTPTRTSHLYTGPITFTRNLTGSDTTVLKYKVFFQGKASITKTIKLRIV